MSPHNDMHFAAHCVHSIKKKKTRQKLAEQRDTNANPEKPALCRIFPRAKNKNKMNVQLLRNFTNELNLS